MNKFQFSDLEDLVNKIKVHFPIISYLSLLSNKACPDQLSDIDKDDSDYQRYRWVFEIVKIYRLFLLDSRTTYEWQYKKEQ